MHGAGAQQEKQFSCGEQAHQTHRIRREMAEEAEAEEEMARKPLEESVNRDSGGEARDFTEHDYED